MGMIDDLRRGGDGQSEGPDDRDTARMDWLQARGRVKARKYGDMKDNFKWDVAETLCLREAIDLAMFAERTGR